MSEKLLVIEDNTDVRENLKEILESADFIVETAQNGQEGFDLIKRVKPDLILCDIMMPVLDGYGVLKKLRADKDIADTPFVFLTAKTSKDDLSRGMELGADDYIMKPFTIAELLKRVKIRLDKRKEVLERTKSTLEKETHVSGTPIGKELREPLKTVTGIGELIMTEHYSMEKGEVVEFVSLIHKTGLELRDLIGESLKFYEVEELRTNSQKIEQLKSQKADSKKVLENVAEQEAQRFGRHKDLVTSFEEGEVAMPAEFLDTVVRNLLNNAFKFSMHGSMVRLISGIDQGNLVLTVSDEGIGMKEEEVQKIGPYRKFSENDSVKGLGLGLVNSQRTVELFGGNFSLKSTKGVGTLVRMHIPLAQ